MGLNLQTAPTEEPVTLTEAKTYLRVTSTDEDTLITSLIQAARIACENITGRAFITQSWKHTQDHWPRGCVPICDQPRIDLHRPKIVSITSLKYYNENNVQQTVSASDYLVSTNELPGGLVFLDTFTFPCVYRRPDAIEVIFTCGYGVAAVVPENVKTAIKFAVAHYFENRGITDELPGAVHALLNPDKYIQL